MLVLSLCVCIHVRCPCVVVRPSVCSGCVCCSLCGAGRLKRQWAADPTPFHSFAHPPHHSPHSSIATRDSWPRIHIRHTHTHAQLSSTAGTESTGATGALPRPPFHSDRARRRSPPASDRLGSTPLHTLIASHTHRTSAQSVKLERSTHTSQHSRAEQRIPAHFHRRSVRLPPSTRLLLRRHVLFEAIARGL